MGACSYRFMIECHWVYASSCYGSLTKWFFSSGPFGTASCSTRATLPECSHFGNILVIFWQHFGNILANWWNFGNILVAFWRHFGGILATFWLNSGNISVIFWQIGGILTTFWWHSGNIFWR